MCHKQQQILCQLLIGKYREHRELANELKGYQAIKCRQLPKQAKTELRAAMRAMEKSEPGNADSPTGERARRIIARRSAGHRARGRGCHNLWPRKISLLVQGMLMRDSANDSRQQVHFQRAIF